MATLDVHFEAPAHPLAYPTQFDRRKDEARFVFNNTIAGHYRNGRSGYNRVGVLLMTWEQDDMKLRESEVNRLEAIFRNKFKFDVQNFQIPSSKTETAFLSTVTSFIHEYDSPDNLIILYYGGHAYQGVETSEFKLAARFEANGEGDPKAFFNDIFESLRLPDVDILFIVDCCFAARAFLKGGRGKRKYELLAAAAPNALVPSAKQKNSFTHKLCKIFDELLGDSKYANGFSTSELYRRIYHQTDPLIKPFLFDQSLFDYGKIWLRPQKIQAQPLHAAKKIVTIGLTLRLTDSPTPANVNEMARALQYIPHVDKVDFGELHAPAEEIREFFFGMKKAMYIRKIIQRLRQRINARKQGRNSDHANTPGPRPLNLRTDVAIGHSHSLDYSQAEAFLRDGTKLPVSMATGKVAPRSPISDELSPPLHSPSFKLFNFLNFFSVAWTLDLRHTNGASPWSWPTSAPAKAATAGENDVTGPELNKSNSKQPLCSPVSSGYNTVAKNERLVWIAAIICIYAFFATGIHQGLY